MRTSLLLPGAGLVALLTAFPACAADEGLDDELLPEDSDEDGKADTTTPSISDDNLNGLWVATVDGQELSARAVIESWPAVGIRLHLDGAVHQLVRSADSLTATDVALTAVPNEWSVYDDVIEGTVGGKQVLLERDTKVKPAITLTFPGDRTYRQFLNDTIIPMAQQDRESYITMRSWSVRNWLKTCELYRSGSWQYKYMKGANWSERNASFDKMVNAIDWAKITPRTLTRHSRFSKAVTDNLKDPSLAGLAMSTFSMYFSTAAGRSLRMPITPDSIAYFITDRPSRAARIGLVVMKTPTHGPLASTFGRQLLDLSAMTTGDDSIYARTMMELLVRSDVRRATQLSGVAKSALTDWYAVMAIEDYRGVAFGNPGLSWGINMTNVQFYGLVAKALARLDQTDSTGKPIIGQVIVGSQLRPGEASYADVLNGGNDMQEYSDMSSLKVLASQFLRVNHPDLVAAVEAAFAGVVPKAELSLTDQADIFRFISAQLYDPQGRTANLTGPAADAAIDATVALFDALAADSAAFEAYILSTGITKSNEPAPKSTGF